jgi:LuxR family maltose regulon positive regulatory protein
MTVERSGAALPSLVATKLHAPRPRRELVDRPRLTGRLSGSSLPSLTLVSAPAGFGKTTLLAEWFADGESDGRALAWLSLDGRDNDLVVFWTYLVGALEASGVGVGAHTADMLQRAEPVQAAVGALLNDLAAIDGEVVVALDDYHVIDSVEVHETVASLLEHLPRNVHLVLAGRADPPLPLARLRARGELLEVRAADLRFTSAEAAAYLNGSMGLTLTEADVDALEARTEGWIAALQLAAISMQGRDDASRFVANFAGDDRFVVDFLVEEVLERQPADVRSFLLETSILDRFTGATCDAVTASPAGDGRAMLERLDRANLFLVALDDRRHWYRYHHLFADVLRVRLRDERPGRVAELHGRASDWFEGEGDRTEAIAQAMAGGHHDQAARLVELAAPRLRQDRQEATLRAWLEALPPEVFVDRPVLAMALIGARVATHDPRGVEALLAGVEAALERSTPPPVVHDLDELGRLPAELLVHRAGLAMLAGDFGATIPLADRVLELVDPADDRMRGVASALLGLGHWAAGDLVVAEDRYAEAIRAFTASDHLPDMLGCSLARGDVLIALGRLGDAERNFEAGLRCTAEHPGLRGAADVHVGLSEVLIERDDLDGAEHHLVTSAGLGDAAGLPQHAYRWRVTMARLCRARGDLDQALELIDEAAPLYDTDFSPPVRPVAALRARVQLACGDLDAALAWVADRRLTVHDQLSYVGEFEHITLCRTVIARDAARRDPGALDDALALLDRLQAAARAGQRVGSLIEVLVLRAAALHARGDVRAATAALEEALHLSQPEGHVRLFLHAGPGVVALLRRVASEPGAGAHARRVLAAAEGGEIGPTVGSPAVQPLVEPLSARELDVLRMLRSDLNGPEIAGEMLVSLNTLRTHTKSIFTKLGVNSRREAVRRAAELGL